MKRDTFDNCIQKLIDNARALREASDDYARQFASGAYAATVSIMHEIRYSVPASAGKPIMDMRPHVWSIIMRGNMYDHDAVLEAEWRDRMDA